MKAIRQKIMVIGIHKCSNRKRINARYAITLVLLQHTKEENETPLKVH